MAVSSTSTAVSTSAGAILLGLVLEVGRNVDIFELGAERLVLPDDRLHLQQIDDTSL